LFTNENDHQAVKYGNDSRSPKSSAMILGGALQPNRAYQFMIYMESRRNATVQATGFVLIRVVDALPQLVVIGYETFIESL
jgi:hypothetical protein